MKIIDVHSHWGTRRGYPLQTAEELAQQHATWNSKPNYMPEAAHRDVIIGHWIHIDPGMGEAGVRELRRCIDKRIGFLGFAVSSSLSPPSSDPAYDPYYKLCIEAGIPVLIFVGTTGLGAGLPGGGGVILDYCHPRLRLGGAHYPKLRIVAGGPAGPGRKPSPCSCTRHRYGAAGRPVHTPDLKAISRRLRDRILFGPTIRSPTAALFVTGAPKALEETDQDLPHQRRAFLADMGYGT
jgi:hypothetical protein